MKTSEERPTPVRPGAASRATIGDVAHAAGVSRQTVSNVVRGRGRAASATRDRVLAAIEQLGYVPHTGAASLRSGRTYRIAYPIPDVELLAEIATRLVDRVIHQVVGAPDDGGEVLDAIPVRGESA